MTYLLDTNVCIGLINDRPAVVRTRLRAVFERGDAVFLSSIALFELWYGVGKSQRQERNSERLAVFLSPFEVLAFDDHDASIAGKIRADLEAAGTPIGAFDVLIAGQAVHRGLTLVTANVAEFRRVTDLKWENWAA
ncbi:MAG: type II toxin-antitoxin system VapC family toxin [Alphaproteobacteria bacterium]|nr:type II toxin-antitoxin system VapC family toxin [Alphaproteobacteria bacterium]